MTNRLALWASVVVALLIIALAPARAQQPVNAVPPAPPSVWQVNIAPYLWLPTIRLDLNYNLPASLGGRLPTEVSQGPGDYLPKLDFAAMLAGDARRGRFFALTDIMYNRISSTGSHIRSIDFFGQPATPIDRSLQTSVGTTLKALIWTLAGGYTVVQRDWGNIDVFAGVRLLWINSVTNYSLNLTITDTHGNGATFGGMGGVSGNSAVWNGIVGVRGKVLLGHTRFFVPYYFDIGGGGSQPTWQIASGLGYQANWGAVSATYRYLSFNQGGNNVVARTTLGGPMLMASFSF